MLDICCLGKFRQGIMLLFSFAIMVNGLTRMLNQIAIFSSSLDVLAGERPVLASSIDFAAVFAILNKSCLFLLFYRRPLQH